MQTIVMGGKGQVGTAITNILKNHGHKVQVLDLDVRPKHPAEVLHVAIPYSKDFVWLVKRAIKNYGPKLVIIHSTVPVGTTRRIGSFAAHSPCRGQHDNLEFGLLRFVKYVAGVTKKSAKMAFEHLKASGFPVFQWAKPEDTELMKLLCLSRYLNDLAFYEVAHGICKGMKVSPGLLNHWTDTYNDGYMYSKFMRPELTFPNGVAGGHCVMPVSKMLAEQTDHPWLRKNVAVFERG